MMSHNLKYTDKHTSVSKKLLATVGCYGFSVCAAQNSAMENLKLRSDPTL